MSLLETIKLNSKLIMGMALGLALLVSVIGLTQSVSAVDTTAACEGVTATGGACDATGETEVKNVIRTVVNILSLVVGAVSVIMIIIGGLRYITSAGDSSSVQGAKNTIIYALVGLVIVILAQAIVAFVVSRIG